MGIFSRKNKDSDRVFQVTTYCKNCHTSRNGYSSYIGESEFNVYDKSCDSLRASMTILGDDIHRNKAVTGDKVICHKVCVASLKVYEHLKDLSSISQEPWVIGNQTRRKANALESLYDLYTTLSPKTMHADADDAYQAAYLMHEMLRGTPLTV